MRSLKFVALSAAASFLFLLPGPRSQAQIAVQIGPAPVCPYGYYDYAPYECAPYGYYGPEWFNGGVFIGAGPWFHGPRRFRGHVDNRFDEHRGYHGDRPHRGDRPDWNRHRDFNHSFRGNEMRDGRGHVVNSRHRGH
ncbi:MAG TPA: hypothetical protein VFW25_01690 [Silvibacterium sp.]|nr:hypothetical protein [Silvibacterium sp.]